MPRHLVVPFRSQPFFPAVARLHRGDTVLIHAVGSGADSSGAAPTQNTPRVLKHGVFAFTDGVRFELTVRFHAHTLSRRAP